MSETTTVAETTFPTPQQTLGADMLMPYERGHALSVTEVAQQHTVERAQMDLPQPSDFDNELAEATDAEVEAALADHDQHAVEQAEPEAEEDDEPRYKVGNEELTLAQLKNGYLRQADYTRKTTELSQEKRAFRAYAERYASNYHNATEAYLKQIALVAQALPEAERAKVATELQRVENERQLHAQELWQQNLSEQEQLLGAAMSSLTAEQAGQELKAAMQFAVEQLGFAQHEFPYITDHRLVLAIMGAAKHYQMETRGKEKLVEKTKGVKVLKPGGRDTTASRPMKAQIERLRDQARRSGSVEDAVALHQAERAARARGRGSY